MGTWVQQQVEWTWQGQKLNTSLEELKVCCLTWNMQGQPPPKELNTLLPEAHHLYIICTQESCQHIGWSMLFPWVEAWEKAILEFLGENYLLLSSCSLGGIHLGVFLHSSVTSVVSELSSDTVSTGLFNILWNKGGVGIVLQLGSKKLLVLGCHLSSGQNNFAQRTTSLDRIEKNLKLFCGKGTEEFVSDKADAAILLGDLNYRVRGERTEVLKLINQSQKQELWGMDQLNTEMKKGTLCKGYTEGKLEFAPTYKYLPNSSCFTGNRVPSWTDRVLYKDSLGILRQISYGSLRENFNSDHKPVFSQFILSNYL